MVNIPIRDIASEGTPGPNDYIVFDDGISMKKGKVSDLADGVRTVASESEAVAGADNAKISTPLRVAQFVSSQIGVSVASKAQGDLANTAVQPGSLGALASKNKAGIADLNTTGTPNTVTWLRGDGQWATPAGGGDMVASVYDPTAVGGNVFDGQPVASRTTLKALSTASFSAAYLKETGRAGAFVWRAGDYSSQVASDSQEAAYVKATAVAATSGAWVRQFSGECAAEWFGTVNDGNGSGGGTNNATALQAALNFCGTFKRPLRLLPGTYRSDSSLTVPAGVDIIGYGAIIDFKSAGNITGLFFTNGGSLLGVTLLGAGNAAMNASGVALACIGTNNSPAAPTFVAGPLIRDCVIDKWAGYGVLFNYTNRGLVEGCLITNIGYAASMGLSANDMLVQGNLIDGVSPGTVDAYGIAFTRQTTTTETADPRSYRCKARGNTVRNVVSVSGDNAQALNTHGGVDLEFANNTVENCEVGCIVAGANNSSGVPSFGPKRCVVSGNVFSTTSYVGVGTMVSGAISGSSVNDWAESCIVTGNTYLGFGISGNGTSAALIAQGTKGVTVNGNTFRSPRCNGIRLGLSNVAFNVSANTIIDPHDASYTVPACVYVSDDTNRGYIGGNTFYFENSGLNTYVAIQSVRIESGRSGLDIEIGRCSFVGLDSTHLAYSEGTATGVNAAGLMFQRGVATVALPSTGAGVLAITFPKRFPATPRVTLQRYSSPVPGTVAKPPILETDTKNVTGFTLIARPYDLTNFGGTGNLTVEWIATT